MSDTTDAPAPQEEQNDKSTGLSPSGLKKESIWEIYYPTGLDEDKRAVPVASFPMIIYFWPAIITFMICGILQAMGDGEHLSPTLGWWATGSLAFCLLVIVTDLSQKKFIIAGLVIVVLALLLYISGEKEMGFVTTLREWIGGWRLTYGTHTYFVISGFLWFFMILGLMQPRLNYWRLEPNEFTHYIQPWGRDQSIPRLGSTVTREIPDVLELFLTFGGGTLVIRREGQVVVRIEHVPFLGRRMKAIERLLGVTRVRTVN
jgi:hypothetical protein